MSNIHKISSLILIPLTGFQLGIQIPRWQMKILKSFLHLPSDLAREGEEVPEKNGDKGQEAEQMGPNVQGLVVQLKNRLRKNIFVKLLLIC
jgi:hypothetical protein